MFSLIFIAIFSGFTFLYDSEINTLPVICYLSGVACACNAQAFVHAQIIAQDHFKARLAK